MPTERDETEAFTARVVGLVQGVGFRYATQRVGDRLGLTGWVRNGADGSVEVFAQGTTTALNEMRAFLAEGPRAARVRTVEATRVAPDPGLATGFHIRF